VEVAGRVPGEVCFADLAPLTDEAQLAPALAAALGLRDDGPSEARLVAALADRPVLLILDNCEHLITGAAGLAHRLLTTCPSLRILATSREALGITGEALFPVGQLAVPSAVRLFEDRAAAVRPGFTVDAGTTAAVERICAALDGLPLAIELAAARLRSLTVAEVDARLADRFRLLSRGPRTAAPRHQTLHAVVEWSWDLLGPAEQTLARRFTVFAGGAVLADVARVCDVDDAEDVLADLVDKSLVEAHDGRYRMLATVREFCAARLAGDDTSRAHAECFAELAETADAQLRGPDQLTWLARLSAEHANLLAALRWAAEASPALALRLVAALSWFWWLQGLRGTVASLAARLASSLSGPAEEYAFCAAAAGTHLDRAAAGLVAHRGPLRRPYVVFLLAIAGRMLDGDPRPDLIGDDPWSQAFQRMGEGLSFLLSGHAHDAEVSFTAALTGFRATGDRWGTASALDKLAGITDWHGDHDRAVAMMDEAIALASELGRVADTPDLHTRRADILARSGAMAAARAGYERAMESARTAGTPDLVANARRGLGDLSRWSGDLAGARDHYTTALAECADTSVGARETRSRILTGLGRAEGDVARFRAALEMAAGNLPVMACALEGLAAVDQNRAAPLLAAATALRGMAVADDPDTPASTPRPGMTREEALGLAGEWL
jgi:predicted ATPase/plasmid stabilization system protein ParE